MKPFGREKTVTGKPSWKRDYHVRRDGHKIENWWEEICCCLCRTEQKRLWRKDVSRELSERDS